jgi:hypothetical protein
MRYQANFRFMTDRSVRAKALRVVPLWYSGDRGCEGRSGRHGCRAAC